MNNTQAPEKISSVPNFDKLSSEQKTALETRWDGMSQDLRSALWEKLWEVRRLADELHKLLGKPPSTVGLPSDSPQDAEGLYFMLC